MTCSGAPKCRRKGADKIQNGLIMMDIRWLLVVRVDLLRQHSIMFGLVVPGLRRQKARLRGSASDKI
jgi:hypothetical protein